MVLRPVLDDGQAQARPANLLGVTLVHPVEALKDAALVGIGDADARVRHPQLHMAPLPPDVHPDAAAGLVVFDGVVAEVIDHLIENLPDPADRLMRPR